MSALWIRALGPLDVMLGGEHISVGGTKQRIVLACLALRANSVVTTDTLVDALWADSPPSKPGPQLQVYVANLRHALEPARLKGVASNRLVGRAGGYVLTATGQELDLLQFRERVEAAEAAVAAGDIAEGAECLREAVELFTDPIFPDLADIPQLRAELDKLEETRLNTHQDLIEVELALGRHTELVGEIQALLSEHPYRERLWEQGVLALYRSGRQAEALAACRKAYRVFTQDLGIGPGPQLRDLENLVLRQDPSLAAPARTNHRRHRQRIDNLPAEHTALLGRDAEVDEVCALFATEGCRLLTITGPGGTGKTRLALAAAARLGEGMPDGVCWVDLAPLSDVPQVPPAIASALGLEDWTGADPLGTTTNFLRSRRLLLVLDNFEHLVEAWTVVADLLSVAPELRILVTSRQPLRIRAEYEYDLAPLALPRLDPPLPLPVLAQVPAVQLFLTRSRAVRPLFELGTGNAFTVARICHRLDGLPLAIELAAAQLRERDEQALLHDLEASLSTLRGDLRDLPDRQRTLSATIAWSYRLLSEAERTVLERLGVFAADPSVEAVRSVLDGACDPDEVDALLTALSRHSLLHRYKDDSGIGRASLLQAIREFARNRLELSDQAATTQQRHAEYYLRVVEELGPRLWGLNQVDAFHRLRADGADLRKSLLWACSPDGSQDMALRLVGGLWHYWEMVEDLSEPYGLALKLLSETPSAPPELRAPALSGTATLGWILGRIAEATKLHGEARQAFTAAGNAQGVAWSTLCLAVQAMERSDNASAERLAEQALAMPQASARTRVAALICLSRLAFYAGRYARAFDLCTETVHLARTLGDRQLLGMALTNLAESTEQKGDFETAEELLLEALTATLDLGAQANIVGYLESLAGIYVHQNRIELAIRMLAAANAFRSDRSHPISAPELRLVESLLADARTKAGPISFGLAWAAGQRLTLAQAVQEVLPSGAGKNDEPGLTQPGSPVILSSDLPVSAAPWT
ncbi:BTAD domain-containing putative transcriptional regulator [Arthrobacter sp. MAHUQ-56]